MSTLTNEELQMLSLLERQTGAVAHDVITGEEGITFIVKPGDAGKAIGKSGMNIRKLAQMFGKNVDVVEDSETVDGFVRNLLAPASIKSVASNEREGRKVVHVSVDAAQKGLAIGKGGERIKRARNLAKRRFNVDDVKIV